MTDMIYEVLPVVLMGELILGLVGFFRKEKVQKTYKKIFSKFLALLFVCSIGGGTVLIATFKLKFVIVGFCFLTGGYKIFSVAKNRGSDIFWGKLLFEMLCSGSNSITTIFFLFTPFLWTVNFYTLFTSGNIYT